MDIQTEVQKIHHQFGVSEKANYEIQKLFDKAIKEAVTEALRIHDVSCWMAFDWNKIETRPTEYGKYLICRKDGKIHWETWNGSGWAYNHNEIIFWAVIVPPCS
jgi:hypothetical protein